MSRDTVGIREMNQHAGKLVREVQRTGKPLIITDRGVPAAVLSSAPTETLSAYERLVRDGRATRATASVRDITSAAWTLDRRPTEILREMRGDH